MKQTRRESLKRNKETDWEKGNMRNSAQKQGIRVEKYMVRNSIFQPQNKTRPRQTRASAVSVYANISLWSIDKGQEQVV